MIQLCLIRHVKHQKASGKAFVACDPGLPNGAEASDGSSVGTPVHGGLSELILDANVSG